MAATHPRISLRRWTSNACHTWCALPASSNSARTPVTGEESLELSTVFHLLLELQCHAEVDRAQSGTCVSLQSGKVSRRLMVSSHKLCKQKDVSRHLILVLSKESNRFLRESHAVENDFNGIFIRSLCSGLVAFLSRKNILWRVTIVKGISTPLWVIYCSFCYNYRSISKEVRDLRKINCTPRS